MATKCQPVMEGRRWPGRVSTNGTKPKATAKLVGVVGWVLGPSEVLLLYQSLDGASWLSQRSYRQGAIHPAERNPGGSTSGQQPKATGERKINRRAKAEGDRKGVGVQDLGFRCSEAFSSNQSLDGVSW
jgi:hypothetical protein